MNLSVIEQNFSDIVEYYKKIEKENTDLKSENKHLLKKINELEDNYKCFTNVSLIVSAKNENEKLKSEMFLLNKKVKSLMKEQSFAYNDKDNDKEKVKVEMKEDKVEIKKDKEIKEDKVEIKEDKVEIKEDKVEIKKDKVEIVQVEYESDSDSCCEVVEEEIDGVIYFVSENGSSRLIYERNWVDGDWDVGDEIGKIMKLSNNDETLIWY
jgi:predicted RNase H-like nuclease (RuvC/YqgF family)